MTTKKETTTAGAGSTGSNWDRFYPLTWEIIERAEEETLRQLEEWTKETLAKKAAEAKKEEEAGGGQDGGSVV